MAKEGEQHEQHQYSSLEMEGADQTSKGKTPIMETPLIGKKTAAKEIGPVMSPAGRMKRVVGIIDFVVRLLTLSAALVATVTMGTTAQTLPFFTQFFQFDANYDDFQAFTYFVVANGAVAVYLLLSLPFSIVTIVRPLAKGPRLFLLTLDTVALTTTTSAASAAAAIVYLAHNGNVNANWIAICSQFTDYCEKSSGAVVASFVTALLIVLLIILSTVALKRH